MKNETATAIKPELIGGVRDYLPQTMLARQEIFDKIRMVYESFGFVPLDTPAVEKLDVLTGNSPSFQMELFHTAIVRGKEDIKFAFQKQNVEMALRFDLTVPLSRVVVAYPQDIPKPFKRYQVGKVWRGEKPQAGRFREFVQFDADIIGSRSILADTEIIHVMYSVMKALGIDEFLIKINNRKILNGLTEYIGLQKMEQCDEVMRILDKKNKISEKEMTKELSRKPENEYDDSAPNLLSDKIDILTSFINIKSGKRETLMTAGKTVGETKIGKEGIRELMEIIENLEDLEIPNQNWTIDLSVARGLGYYTGPVFETTLTDLPEMGSVYSGGRFDGLSNRFVSDSNIPGVGASVGVDRLFVALEQLGKLENKPSKTQVLVAFFDKNLKSDYLKISNEIRKKGISVEIYLDAEPLKAQITYAAKQGIPLVIIIGSDEKEKNTVSLRNMKTRKQETVDKNKLIDKLTIVLNTGR